MLVYTSKTHEFLPIYELVSGDWRQADPDLPTH